MVFRNIWHRISDFQCGFYFVHGSFLIFTVLHYFSSRGLEMKIQFKVPLMKLKTPKTISTQWVNMLWLKSSMNKLGEISMYSMNKRLYRLRLMLNSNNKYASSLINSSLVNGMHSAIISSELMPRWSFDGRLNSLKGAENIKELHLNKFAMVCIPTALNRRFFSSAYLWFFCQKWNPAVRLIHFSFDSMILLFLWLYYFQ